MKSTQTIETVQDLLDLPFSSDFKVLAGKAALDNVIAGGNIMDNPNALDWLSPNEVLITSGYFLTNEKEKQEELLLAFKQLNISAILIKTLTFFETIPQSIIDYCESINLPLIEVPYGMTFSAIINTITNELSSNTDNQKQLAIDSHSRFFESSLNGGGISVITKDLGSLLNSTTIVVDTDWNILSYENIIDEHIQYFTAGSESTYFDTDALDDLPVKVDTIKHVIYRVFTKDGNSVKCAIAPIYFNTINYGYIIIISGFNKLTSMDHIVIESASMALALQISQKMESDRNSNRVIRDFFKQLLSGEMIDSNILKSVGIDIDYSAHYSFIIFNVDVSKEDNTSLMKRKQIETSTMKKILSDIKRFTRDANVDLQTFKQSNRIFGFYKKNPNIPDEKIRIEERAFFNQLLTFVHARIDTKTDIKVMIGSSQPVSNLRLSYEEALRIDSFNLDEDQAVFFYDDFFLELFLAKHMNNNDEEEFYTHYLHPLIQYDESNKSELLKTLQEYLYNQFNVADTARKLFIHRNTMLYRLGKIEEILNVDIHSHKMTLALLLAFSFYDKKPLVDNLL